MIILDGRKLAEKILRKLKKEIKKYHLKLGLAVVLIGENPISEVFTKQKEKISQKIGIKFRLFKLSAKISFQKLKEDIEEIVLDSDNSGIIIQLPIPKKFNTQEILNLIPVKKDIDCLSEKSFGKFYQGSLLILPPVVGAILKILKEYKISIKGKNIVVIGTGKLVGLPTTLWLLKEKATVTAVNEFTKNISFFTKKADILISGAGKPNFITGKMINKGIIVIDAGTSIEKGRLVGDVDFKSVSKKARYIAPVPGGIGPLTITCLFENLIILNKNK